MNRIVIEAKDENTPECHFLKTILQKLSKEATFTCMNGVDRLFSEPTIGNLIQQADEEGDRLVVLVDADSKEKGAGFAKRELDIQNLAQKLGISFPFFIYPNHKDEGDVEVLIEAAARKDLHKVVFDCLDDYEKCVKGAKNDKGEYKYVVPNRKNRVYTYIASQKMSKSKRDRLGHGDWLFNSPDLWNLDSTELEPLKNFLMANLG